MTLCVITGHQCHCNPDDGKACDEGSPAAVQAALNAEGRQMEAEIERLRADVASEQKWGELWYFVSDEAPGEFERIVSEWTPSRWIGEAQKLMAEKR